MFTKRILFSLFIVILTFSLISSTQVYRCENGVKTYLGEANYGVAYSWCSLLPEQGGGMGCFCSNPEENKYLTSDGTEHCLLPSQEPKECSEKIVTCYEAIEGKCVGKGVYGECEAGYGQYSNLQDCITYVNYYGGKINFTYIFLGGMFIILLIILVILIRFIKKKK